MPDTYSNVTIKEPEETWGEEDEDFRRVDHQAEITIIEVLKGTKTGKLAYTFLIKDKANLEKPIAIDLPLSPDEAGRLKANTVFLEDLERDYGIKVE